MSKVNQQDIDKLIELVGGRDNIATVSHCITRLRFVLNDPAIAKPKEIEQLRMVKGCFTNAGQFQVVIGTEWAITTRPCWRPPARPPPIKSRPTGRAAKYEVA
jgi:phosphotransferase system IIB component